MPSLEEAIQELVFASGAEAVGVAACGLASENWILCDADRGFHPASTFKLCVMVEAFRRAEEGTFSLKKPLAVINGFPSIADGSPFSLDIADDSDPGLFERIGTEVSAQELVERMIVRSSNLATNILMEFLPPADITTTMRRLGAGGLSICRGVEDKRAYRRGLNNVASARDLAACLLRLGRRKAVSPAADETMIEILLRQEFGEGVPRLLPPGTKVAHKTGWNGNLYHDAAIVYPEGGRPYVLVVMTEGLSDMDKGPELVAKISRLVYDASE